MPDVPTSPDCCLFLNRATWHTQEDTLLWGELMFPDQYYSQRVTMRSDRDRDTNSFSLKMHFNNLAVAQNWKKKKNILIQTWNLIHCWDSSSKDRVAEIWDWLKIRDWQSFLEINPTYEQWQKNMALSFCQLCLSWRCSSSQNFSPVSTVLDDVFQQPQHFPS